MSLDIPDPPISSAINQQGFLPESDQALADDQLEGLRLLSEYRCRLVSCACWYHTRDTEFQYREMSDEAIIIPLTGGVRLIEETGTSDVEVGSMICLPRWHPFRNVMYESEQQSRHMLVIHCDWLDSVGNSLFALLVDKVVQMPDDGWRQRLLGLYYSWMNNSQVTTHLGSSLLTTLMMECFFNGLKIQAVSDHPDPLIERSVRGIRSSNLSEVSVESLAKDIGLSTSRYRQRFRKSYGMTPGIFLTNRRMQYAAELLSSSLVGLGSIAHEIGFSSVTHFHAAFKKRFDCTPEEWRRANGTTY